MFALTIPFVFGIPPLVAKIYWPDLSAEAFFQPFVGKNPQDLVFVGLVLKLLPHGLIGIFIAAMMAIGPSCSRTPPSTTHRRSVTDSPPP